MDVRSKTDFERKKIEKQKLTNFIYIEGSSMEWK